MDEYECGITQINHAEIKAKKLADLSNDKADVRHQKTKIKSRPMPQNFTDTSTFPEVFH